MLSILRRHVQDKETWWAEADNECWWKWGATGKDINTAPFFISRARKYRAVLLVSRIEEKGLAQHFHAMSANIHNLCRAWSWEKDPVHPSPRKMVVSPQTVVRNHTQLLHDMLLYGGTFYILLSGPGKINAKSQLSPSYFAALKHCPLSGFVKGRKSPYIHIIKSLYIFCAFVWQTTIAWLQSWKCNGWTAGNEVDNRGRALSDYKREA